MASFKFARSRSFEKPVTSTSKSDHLIFLAIFFVLWSHCVQEYDDTVWPGRRFVWLAGIHALPARKRAAARRFNFPEKFFDYIRYYSSSSASSYWGCSCFALRRAFSFSSTSRKQRRHRTIKPLDCFCGGVF